MIRRPFARLALRSLTLAATTVAAAVGSAGCQVNDPAGSSAHVATPATRPSTDREFVIATYNIENWRTHFIGYKLRNATLVPADPALDGDAKSTLSGSGDEDNWEVSQVIFGIDPDILVVQEGAEKADVEFFNRRWLGGKYETIIQFPTNTTRGQHLLMLLKPGYKAIEVRDQYHLEPDTVANDRGERLFARGPAFVLVETPSGYRLWVGTTHQKSKFGNSVEVTHWRTREAARTRQIMQELKSQGPEDVILLGDFNDELGMDDIERQAGVDTVAANIGAEDGGFLLATQSLAQGSAITFGGYFRDRNSFIDHIVISDSMADQVRQVAVYRSTWADVASDHYPVFIRLRTDPVGR